MATDANMDWSHSTPTGYVPAFRSGGVNQLAPSHDRSNSYMTRADTSIYDPRTQYAPSTDYHANNGHLGSTLHTGLHAPGPSIEEHYWPQQSDPSRDHILPDGPSTIQHESNNDQPIVEAETSLLDGEENYPNSSRHHKKTTIPRSERRKHYKPKPETSNPRLFRPFVPLETADTTPTQWTMPPIVGSWLMFSNKMVRYRPMPPDIASVRDKLFTMKESILLKNSQEVADYVPHITNVWRRAVQRVEIDEVTGLQTEYWHCRTKKAMRPRKDDGQGKGVRNREKKSQTLFHDQTLCNMRIRVTSFTKHADRNPFHLRVHGVRAGNGNIKHGSAGEHQRWGGGPCKCVAEWVHFELANVDPNLTGHTHDLDVLDGYKRSEALQVLAKNKCEEGNSYSATTKWIHNTFGDISKQVYNLDKGDVANAVQLWRSDYRHLVPREEVPEDSDEMITMRKCVDAILEADARSLREALREVLKDSDELTKKALKILEKHNPTPPEEPEEPEESWRLTEGVGILDLPPPGPSEKLRDLCGVFGPPRTPYSPLQTSSHTFRLGQGYPLPPTFAPNILGPDGRPIHAPTIHAASTAAPPQGNPHVVQYAYPQQPGPVPANTPQARGVPLQPRLPMSVPVASPQVEVRYLPAPPPSNSTPQRGSVHPITVSLEVPSCPLNTCKQCRRMHRGMAGRTFFFQDHLHTPAHFAKLQDLLRDPKQLLNDEYTRILHRSQVNNVHPHPALHAAQSQKSNAPAMPPLHRAPASAPSVSQVQQGPAQEQYVSPYHSHAPPSAAASLNSAPPELNIVQYTSGPSSAPLGQSRSSPVSIHDQPLPVPIVVEDDDGGDNDHANKVDNGNKVLGKETNAGESENGVRHDVNDTVVNEENTARESDSGAQLDNISLEQDGDGAGDGIGDQDEDEERPAKRRKLPWSSAAEDQ